MLAKPDRVPSPGDSDNCSWCRQCCDVSGDEKISQTCDWWYSWTGENNPRHLPENNEGLIAKGPNTLDSTIVNTLPKCQFSGMIGYRGFWSSESVVVGWARCIKISFCGFRMPGRFFFSTNPPKSLGSEKIFLRPTLADLCESDTLSVM